MGKARVALCVLAAALVLAGCVSRSSGEPERAPASGHPVDLAFASDDDELNPCSLTGPAAFEPRGTATMPGRPDLDNCRVRVTTSDGPVFVSLGEQTFTEMLPEDRRELADLGRGAKIVRLDDTCDTALTYGADRAILVTTTSAGDRTPPRDVLCELTKGAAEGVFNVLAGGRAKFWTPAPGSFAGLDACEVLPWPLVARQLGLEHEKPASPVMGHWCEWGATEDNQATLTFPVAASPADLGDPGPAETIGGRESWVVEIGTGCSVFTRHIEFELAAGTFEFARLHVEMPDPCAAARALAAEAWTHLPG